MHESLITKKIIAYSLKKIMQETPFQKVSIRQIMETAEIRRQTFYDYFQDKYELLSWTYQQEISENIRDFLDYEEWEKVLYRMLRYFEANQVFYRNALAVSEQNSFDTYFYEHTKELFQTALVDLARKNHAELTEETMSFVSAFAAHGIVGMTKEWLFNECATPPEILARNIADVLESTMKGMYRSHA